MPPNSQPYLYAQPQRYSAIDPYNGFDPKAVTRASHVPPASTRPRPQQQGPLLDFNRHPDSYLIMPYGQTDAKPMHPSTNKAIKVTRWVQLGIRSLQLIGALGMLVCVICIQNTNGSESYIIRVPAAVDILTTTYAIYHLARPAKERPPASTASYHVFALVIDAGLIPFYVFIAMLARSQLAQSPHNELRWRSFFNNAGTDKILLSSWLDGAVLASMHLASCFISLYLVLVFRKIAQLPPDLNPLEDNLTSRSKSKHKYKNSEISKSDISGPMTASSVTLADSGRSSPVKETATVQARPLSFLHTRTNSDFSYSPHNPNTANMSRSNLSVPHLPSVYSQPRSDTLSRANLSAEDQNVEDTDAYARTQTLQSFKSILTSSSAYSDHADSADRKLASTPPLPRKSSQRHSLLSDNWFVHKLNGAEGHDKAQNDISQPVSPVEEDEDEDIIVHSGDHRSGVFSSGNKSAEQRSYQPVRQESSPNTPRGMSRSAAPMVPPKDEGYFLAPLGMNPPTPPPGSYSRKNSDWRSSGPLAPTSGNVVNSINQNGSNSPKSKYYGDLGSAVSGIRNSPRSSPRTDPYSQGSSNRQSKHDSGISGVRDQAQLYIPGSHGHYGYAGVAHQDFASNKKQSRLVDANGRVVSRSGADITDEPLYDGLGDRFAMNTGSGNLRGRNISGKDAEEGRGGFWRRDY